MFIPPLGALDSLAASMGKSQAYEDYFRITSRRPPMIRTTTTYRYDLKGNITQRVVEEEEIAADATPTHPSSAALPAKYDKLLCPWGQGPDCTTCFPPRELEPTQPAEPKYPVSAPAKIYREPDTVRSTYRTLTEPEKKALAAVKAAGQAFIDSLNSYVMPGRELDLALANAEQSVMWATKSITT